MSRPFSGFSTQRDRLVSLPVELLGEVMAEVRELAELKVLLTVFRLLAGKTAEAGQPRAVSWDELRQDEELRRGLVVLGQDKTPEERLGQALEQAINRGLLLHVVVQRSGHAENWYLVNTAANRKAVEQLAQRPPEELTGGPFEGEGVEVRRPTIFGLYEQNIGLVPPMLADELAEAAETYPPEWIEEAFREAVRYNRRNWRYIRAILERWTREGRRWHEGREEVALGDGQPATTTEGEKRPGRPAIFDLYESKFGPIPPEMVDELTRLDIIYPDEWIKEAFAEADLLGRRDWRYIREVLEQRERRSRGRWS